MKKLITLSISILLSISIFATNYPPKDTPFSKVVFGKNGMVTKTAIGARRRGTTTCKAGKLFWIIV